MKLQHGNMQFNSMMQFWGFFVNQPTKYFGLFNAEI